MNRGVLGVLIGIPTLAAVSVGGTYAGTGETWESHVLKGKSWEKYAENDTWTFDADELPPDWKEFFECCCKDSTSGCSSSGADSDGKCKSSNSKVWKVKQDKKEAIKNKCSKVGSRVDWALNRNLSDNIEYTNYSQVCFKQKSTGN